MENVCALDPFTYSVLNLSKKRFPNIRTHKVNNRTHKVRGEMSQTVA